MNPGSTSSPTAREAARLDPEHQLLTLVFNSARDMMLLARVEPGVLFRVISVNRTYLETIRTAGFDFDAEDFPGRTFAETVAMFGFSAEAIALNRSRYEQVLATKKPLEYEEVTHAPSGVCHGQSTITPILDAAGECTFLLYSSQNVTERRRTDDALREHRRLLATLLDNLPGMSYRCRNDPQWTMEFVSEGCRALTGYAPEDLLGNRRVSFADLMLEEYRTDVWNEVQAALQARRPFEIVYRIRRADGGVAWMWERGQGVFGDGPEPLAIEGFITDITARKQTEEALRVSEEKFAKAFRASPDAISLSDLTTGRFLDVNEGYEHLSGYPRAEIIGRTSTELGFWADPADRDKVLSALARDGKVRDLQVQARNRAGELIFFLMSAEKVEIAGRACLVVVSRDVTARLKAERYLLESEEKFAKAFRSSPSPLTITEIATGRYIEVNAGFEQVTGYRREDVVGRTSLEMGIWENPADRDKMVRLLREGGVGRGVEFRFKHRDGHPLVMRCSFEGIELAGVACLLTVLEDITEQRRAEQALRESEERVASAFRATPDAMAIADFETNVYLEVNEGFERLFGYKRAEVIGRSPFELKILADPSFSELVRRRLDAGEQVRDIEMPVLTKSGERRTILHSVERIQVGGRECLLRVSRDITERKRAEEVLRQSEEKFAKAFRASPNAISISELVTGKFVEVNEGFERLSGYSRAELIGRSNEELHLWADPADRSRMLAELERAGLVRNMRTRVRNRAGDIRDFLLSVETVEIGRQTCLVILGSDISEQLLAEQALRESEEKFAKAFGASPDAISVHEMETGRYVDANAGCLRFFGYTREEIVGHLPLDLGIWHDPAERREFITRLRRDGSVRGLTVQIRVRSGAIRLCEISAEPVEIAGRPHNVTVLRDITAALAAEKALRESEEKFAIAFRASPIPLTIVELETGRFIEINHSFEKTTGYTRAETIGRTTLELGLWPVAADREAFAERLAREGVVRNLTVTFRIRDGTDLLTRCNSELIELGGKRCILTLAEDISEEQRAEEERALLEAQLRQSQKLEALGTLAGGIAHDFNNILTAIVVNQELAVMDIDNPVELRDRLGEISRASNRAKDLVRQILAFSRQQSEQVRTRQRLATVVQEAMGLVRASLPATIEIDQLLDAGAPPVLADGTQVHQIVMNLCTNAAHAMRDRPGRLTVRLAARTLDDAQARPLAGLRAGAYAQLTISDTGHGMTKAVLARIFEPFFTTKGPGEGTGLGLAVVHGIMRDHSGGIFVESTPEAGTQFDLYFPAAPEAEEGARVAAEDVAYGRGESVLVVDDEPAVCDAVGSMLRKLNYRVESFTEPERALARFRAEPGAFNLLLTDRTMPRLTGPQLIGRIEAIRPDLPVLVMSGLSSGPGTDPVVRHRVLPKPLDIIELSRAVRAVLAPPSS